MSSHDGTTEWMNPPPPGTTDDLPGNSKEKYSSFDRCDPKKDVKFCSQSPSRTCNDQYPNRSRSRSRERYSRHVRGRHRRSRSRERRYRSRSGSRKRYLDRKHSHKSNRNKYSRSRSRSHSRRHRKSRSRSSSVRRRRSTRSKSYSSSSQSDRETHSRHGRMKDSHKSKTNTKSFEEVEDEEEPESLQENTFKNDGSFLEMFKKMQEEQAKSESKTEQPEVGASEVKKLPFYGKRRGGRILKTGVVQKPKNPNEIEDEPKDAWSVYMKEVRKYKEACCDDDSKTRPLVK